MRKLEKGVGHRPDLNMSVFYHPVAIFLGEFQGEINIGGYSLVVGVLRTIRPGSGYFVECRRMPVQ